MDKNNVVKMPLRFGVVCFRIGGKHVPVIVDPALAPSRSAMAVNDESGPRSTTEAPRQKVVSIARDEGARDYLGVPIGDGYYTGCAYGSKDTPRYTGKNDCPICEGSGLKPADPEVYRKKHLDLRPASDRQQDQ